MNRNFYDILIAKFLNPPVISELRLQVIERDSYADGTIVVDATEYETYRFLTVNSLQNWSATATVKTSGTIFVGWFRDAEGQLLYSYDASISGTISEASITLYAIFQSNVTVKSFCYSANTTSGDAYIDACKLCNETKDVYFNSIELNALGYTGTPWYTDETLTTFTDSGIYVLGESYESVTDSSTIYRVTTDLISTPATQFIELVGNCGEGEIYGCDPSLASVIFSLIQPTNLNVTILDVNSYSTSHVGNGVPGEPYSFDVQANAISPYVFGSIHDINITTPGFSKSNAYLSDGDTVLNFTINQDVYAIESNEYELQFAGAGAQVSPTPIPTTCIQYTASTYSNIAQTVTYVDCNGNSAFFSIGGVGGYSEVNFCAYQINNYPAGVVFTNNGGCAGSPAPDACACWDFLGIQVTSAGTFSFIDCDGNSRVFDVEVGFNDISDYCIQDNSWAGTATYTVVLKGNCCDATSVTTCTTWKITNVSTTDSYGYTYTDCDGVTHASTLTAGQSVDVCAFYQSDISVDSGLLNVSYKQQCSTATPPPEEPDLTYAVELSFANCRIEGTCDDNGTCGVRFSIATANAPAGYYIEANVTQSNGASASIYTDGTYYYLDYTETSESGWAYVTLSMKNSNDTLLVTSSNNYIIHSPYWSYLGVCSSSTPPPEPTYDRMYVQSPDGLSGGYVQYDANYAVNDTVSTTISSKFCYTILSVDTSTVQPTNTITGTCTITPPSTTFQALNLRYHQTDLSLACAATASTIYGNSSTLIGCTILATSINGTPYAALGWYSDGTNARYWNGSNFTLSTACNI